MGSEHLVGNKIAAGIQNLLTSQTAKASYKQIRWYVFGEDRKLMPLIHLKRAHLLAEIDLSKMKSDVYSSDVHKNQMETLAINTYTSPPWVNFISITGGVKYIVTEEM